MLAEQLRSRCLVVLLLLVLLLLGGVRTTHASHLDLEGDEEPQPKGRQDTMSILATKALETKEAQKLAKSELERISRLEPQDLFEQATIACQQNQNGKGYVMFRLFSERFPALVEGYTNAAVALERMGKHELAKGLYREALKRFPGNQKIILSLINVLQHEAVQAFEEKRFQRALSNYNEIISLAPTLPDVYLNAGAIHERLGAFEEAKRMYHKAINLAPNMVNGYNALCRMLMFMIASTTFRELGVTMEQRHQAFEEAKHACSAAIRLSPTDPTANMNLGLLYKESLDFDSAVQHLLIALNSSPDDHVILNNLASALSRQGNLEEAIKYQQRVVELTNSPGAMDALGTMIAPWDRHSKLGQNSHWNAMEIHLKAMGHPRDDKEQYQLCRSWLELSNADEHITVLQPADEEMLGRPFAKTLKGDSDVPTLFRDKQTILVELEDCHMEGRSGVIYTNDQVVAWLGVTTEVVRDFRGKATNEVWIESPVLPLVHQVGHNYYHWTVEQLTRLILSYDHLWGPEGSEPDLRLLVADLKSHEWFQDALDFFDFKPVEPLSYTPVEGTRYAFAQLYWFDWVQLDKEDLEQNDLWSGYLPSAYAVRRLNQVATAQYAKKRREGVRSAPVVYVHRGGVRMVNDEELFTDIMKKMLGDNFFVFSTEKREGLTLMKQVETFHDADIIMGPHGAGLTNMVFTGSKNTSIVEFAMTPTSNRCFAYLAEVLGLDYWLVPEVSCFYHKKYDMTPSKAKTVAAYILRILENRNLTHLIKPDFDPSTITGKTPEASAATPAASDKKDEL